jgi:hypothetical protein
MGSRKGPGVNPPVISYGSGLRGNEIRRANSFLQVQMALIVGVFSGPYLLNNSVYL